MAEFLSENGRQSPESSVEETGLETAESESSFEQPATNSAEQTDQEESQPSETVIDLSDVPVLVNSSLSPRLNPYTFQGKRPEPEYQTYIVEPSDTPIGIADSVWHRV